MNETIIKTENDFYVDSNETCVMCDAVTNIKRSTHIDFRENYVEGCGQLCVKCFNNTFLNEKLHANYTDL